MAKKKPAKDPIAAAVDAFSAAELVAIAGLVKDDKLTEAKRSLADGFTGKVDFSIRIVGAIQKGESVKPGTWSRAATVDLGAPHVFAAMRKLGITKRRFENALKVIATDVPFDEEFGEVINAEASARAAKLPDVTGTSAGRAGSVHSQVSATKLKV